MHPNQNPKLDDPVLLASVEAKVAQLKADLAAWAAELPAITMANSLGAEDMVLTDVIATNQLPIEIFSLDTGRLPLETYDLMAEVQKRYGLKLKFFYPNHEAIETFTRENGINAFYDSVELRKACCHARKVEPLGRALAGKQAWITGLRAQQSTTRTDLPKRQFDEGNGLVKFNPLSDWTEKEVWAYIRLNKVPYNALHDKFYPSIGCAPCTRPVSIGEDVRAGRWWWENPETKECGLHVKK
ncbi:phosphoadenylyl-sulfate reductase [Zoogloea sp. LCSB751]|uniref:phosphoadenylyl-sulfate reductase n=1 Tax=Zoogloea sp. LCSB751 TaxID=1965277 RepID=UPI0009A4C35A|nr:phosphoadenylyl-sulfate reductase [Zoogloea sp. LCSB751]